MPRRSAGRRRAGAAGVLSLCLSLSLCCAAAAPLAAEPVRAEPREAAPALLTGEPETWRVATHPVPPLVMDEDGRLRGFSIDLWNALARDLGVRTA